MSRNGSGTYSPPNNTWNPAVGGTTVLADDWNATLTNLAAALTTSIASDGQTPTTAKIPFASGVSVNAGSVSSPGLSFTASATTGVYSPASGQLAISAAGVQSLLATSTLVTLIAGQVAGAFGVTGVLTASSGVVGNVTGNASTATLAASATALAAARNIALSGDVTGSQSFDGTADATISSTIASGAVSNAKLTSMSASTIKANLTGGSAAPTDASYAAVLAALWGTLTSPTIGSNGSYTLPNGLILKWGAGTLVSTGGTVSETTITFGSAFPNNNFVSISTARGQLNSTQGLTPIMSTITVSASSARFRGDTNNGSISYNQNVDFFWFAVGN